MNIYQINNSIKDIYYKLENGEGFDIETGELLPEIQRALTISKGELQSKAIDYGFVIKAFDDDINIIDKEIERLKLIKQQKKANQIRMKEIIKNTMLEFGIEKITSPTLNISFRKSQAIEITDETLIPQNFMRTKTIVEPDKTAIKEALKNGECVYGVKLVDNYNLQIN